MEPFNETEGRIAAFLRDVVHREVVIVDVGARQKADAVVALFKSHEFFKRICLPFDVVVAGYESRR